MKIQKTDENIMACLAANALGNRCEFSDLFIGGITQEEIATIAAKNPTMAYNVLYNYHNKVNGCSKLILLQGVTNDEKLLKELLSVSEYTFKPTLAEYNFIITHLLNINNCELLLVMFKGKRLTKDDAKRFKVSKDLKEKWNGFLIMNELLGNSND
jgi:hypothetical protein